MGCACRRNKKEAAIAKKAELASPPPQPDRKNIMVKLVNFEGKMIPFNSIPHGSVFIRGVWYSSVNKMPDDIRDYYNKQLKVN